MTCAMNMLQAAPRERRKLEYQESLKERYQHLREINRISKYVLPRALFLASSSLSSWMDGLTQRHPTVSPIYLFIGLAR